VGVRQLCLRRIGVRGEKSLKTAELLDKSSAADLLPTYIFKLVIDLLAPFVAELFNRSLAAAWIPSFQGSIHHAGVEETGNLWQSYKQERDCLVHFLRLLAVCWPGAQSA